MATATPILDPPGGGAGGGSLPADMTFSDTTHFLLFAASYAGQTVKVTSSNTSTAASSAAELEARVAALTSGDPGLRLGVTGGIDWLARVRATVANNPLEISHNGNRVLYLDPIGGGVISMRPSSNASRDASLTYDLGAGITNGPVWLNRSSTAGTFLTILTEYTNASGGVGLAMYNGSAYKYGIKLANRTGTPKIELGSDGGDVVIGTSAAIATNATNGFAFITYGAGAPTGVPEFGVGALYLDTTNSKLWAYTGTWKGVVVS